MVVDSLTDEEGRLAALHRLGLPGIGPHDPLDRIARIAQTALHAPIATVSIVDRSRQIMLAARGVADTPIEREQSLCSLAVRDSRILIIPDCANDRRAEGLDRVRGPEGIAAYLAVPLVTLDGYAVGCLEIIDTRVREFTEDEVLIAVNLGRLAMNYLSARQSESADNLTGAMTRRRFQAEIEREFQRATRYERPAALIFLDIDGFAEINTAMGLSTADDILKSLANRCMDTLRFSDSFGRIGGEEFGILLPETLAYEASQCAERLREDISRLRFRNRERVVSVTASFGIAPLAPGITSGVDWFARADIALYGAKQLGGNCVAFAPTNEESDQQRSERSGEPAADRLH